MRIILLLLAFCPILIGQDASLDGVTVNALTGEPIPGVHVKLFTGTFGSGYDSATHLVYGALSDRSGHFSISKLQPGSYFYSGEFRGFISLRKIPGNFPYPGVTIKPNERVANFKVELTPRSVLSGRVIDEAGDPVQGFSVQAVPASPDDPVAATINDRVTTDDRGEFRLPGAPGRYYLKASPQQEGYRKPEVRVDGSAPPVYTPTFFPNSPTKERASVIEAAPGADIRGIEIRLARQRSITISGVVKGIPTNFPTNCLVQLWFGESADLLTAGNRSALAMADGKFSFPNIPPAHSVLSATSMGSSRLQSGVVVLKPSEADISNVELNVSPGVEIAGTLLMAGQPLTGIRSIALQPAGPGAFARSGLSGNSDKEGAFRIPAVFPGAYKVKVQPLPENAYVAAVHLDGNELPIDNLDLNHTQPGSKLRITVGSDGGEISGTVRDRDGQLIVNSESVVFLLAGPLTISNAEPVPVTSRGTFEIRGVRPGKYRLVAIDSMHSGPIRSMDSFNEMIVKAAEIEVKSGARLALEVKVTGAK